MREHLCKTYNKNLLSSELHHWVTRHLQFTILRNFHLALFSLFLCWRHQKWK